MIAPTKALGGLKPFECDLSRATARVFAALPREIKGVAISATQSIKAGDDLEVAVEFQDAEGKRLVGVLPFHLAIRRPDGTAHSEFYRSTTKEGTFSMAVPIAANDPAGKWAVEARSQLSGDLATLPVEVGAARPAAFAVALAEPVVVRQRDAIEAMLAKGASVVLPVFDPALLPAAEQVKSALAPRGVTVDIRQNPSTSTYTIAYELTDAQKQENARADRGETIGKIKRETVNENDWASGLSGWRFGKPLILLDLWGRRTPTRWRNPWRKRECCGRRSVERFRARAGPWCRPFLGVCALREHIGDPGRGHGGVDGRGEGAGQPPARPDHARHHGNQSRLVATVPHRRQTGLFRGQRSDGQRAHRSSIAPAVRHGVSRREAPSRR